MLGRAVVRKHAHLPGQLQERPHQWRNFSSVSTPIVFPNEDPGEAQPSQETFHFKLYFLIWIYSLSALQSSNDMW